MERLFRRPFGLCFFMHPEGFAIVNFSSQLPGGREEGRDGGKEVLQFAVC